MLQTYTYSGNDYTDAAQGTTVFALTSTEGNAIPYLQRAHIHVYISADDGDTWTEQARPNDWDFNREGTSVVLETGIDDGEWVRVLRITPILNRFVDFADGSLLTAAQLDQGEDYSRFCDQELSDSIANETASALRYMGQIDLTADNAPGMPQPGDVYINTGDGTTIQGGDPGWVGIVGDEVSGGEQVVYQADLTWAILQTPASQVGVLSVTGTAPITVDNSDSQNPIVGFSDAPNDGVQYVRQGVGDPRVVSWAAVNIPPGTIIADPLPDGPHEAGQLGYNTGDNRLYIWVFNTDDPPVGSWVDASPVGSNMPTGGGSEDAFYENTATIDEDYSITETKNAGTFGPITVNGAVTVPDGSAWTVVGGGEGGGGGGDLWVRNGTTLSPRSSGDNLDDIGNINAASVTGSGSITTTSDIVSGGEWGVDNETSIQSNFGFGVRRDSGGQVFAAYKDAYGDAGRKVLINSNGNVEVAGYITGGDPDPGNVNGDGYVNLDGPNGLLFVRPKTSTAFQVSDKNSGGTTFLITAEGNVEAAGKIQLSTFDITETDGYGWRLDAGISPTDAFGQLDLQCLQGAAQNNATIRVVEGTTTHFLVQTGGTTWIGGDVYAAPQIQLNSNGSAIFTGTVTADGKVLTRNVELQIAADDPANYVSTTDAEGETTSVYNGPKLSVLDELLDLRKRATQQDAVIAQLVTALRSQGVQIDTTDIQEGN